MAGLRPTSYRGVALRAAGESDSARLYQIFMSSRTDLLSAVTDWDQARQHAFVRTQFDAQQKQYQRNYPDARFDVVVRNSEIIGHIVIAPFGDELRLVDMTLSPDQRNRGIGHALVQDLLDEGARLQKLVSLHVRQGNPARRLYLRLGFIDAGEQGIYSRMEWRPSSMPAAARLTGVPSAVS